MSSQEDKNKELIEKFKASAPIIRRSDKASMERRRQHVWQMWLEGVPQTVMAEILNVSRVTISSDLDYIQKRQQGYIGELRKNPNKQEMDVGLTCRKLEAIAEAAFAEYSAAATAGDKDRFLNTANRALVNRNRILVETGFLPKAGVEVKATIQHSASFEDKYGGDSKWRVMDDPTSRKKILEATEAALKLGLKQVFENPGELKPADVKVIEPPTS